MRRGLVVLSLGLGWLGCSSDEKADAGSMGTVSTTSAASSGTDGSSTSTTSTSGTEGATSAATTETSGSTSSGGASSTSTETSSASTDDAATSAGGASSTAAGGSTTEAAGGSGGSGGSGGGSTSELGFFVSSDTSVTGNLGGLAGADARCQALAEAVGAGDRTWRAYLSAESDPDSGNMPVNARDRIGAGPWINSEGVVLANDLDELHALNGDPALFIDENGERINGQWEGSPTPNQHDILTGSDTDGNVMTGSTCDSWTSESGDVTAQVGHADGLGPNQSSDPPYNSWNSAHENGGCDDTAPLGGAGRIYCFAAD